jgi:hypothetical protein
LKSADLPRPPLSSPTRHKSEQVFRKETGELRQLNLLEILIGGLMALLVRLRLKLIRVKRSVGEVLYLKMMKRSKSLLVTSSSCILTL